MEWWQYVHKIHIEHQKHAHEPCLWVKSRTPALVLVSVKLRRSPKLLESEPINGFRGHLMKSDPPITQRGKLRSAKAEAKTCWPRHRELRGFLDAVQVPPTTPHPRWRAFLSMPEVGDD